MYYSWRYNATGYLQKYQGHHQRPYGYRGPWRIERSPIWVPVPPAETFIAAFGSGSTWVVPPIHIGSDR